MKILGIQIPFTELGLRQQWNHHTGEWENYPLFWFNDPEHIIINAQQSKISLHDGQKKSSSEVIFTQIFDLVLLVVGFLFIMAPIVAILGDVVPAYLDEDPYPDFEWPMLIIEFLVFGGVGVICLSFIDRKRSLTIDGTSNQVKFEYVKWPRYGTINYELRSPISYEIVKKTWGQSYHDEHTGGRETTHPGIEIVFDLVGQGSKAILFLEGDDARNQYDSVLRELFSTLGRKEITDEKGATKAAANTEDKEWWD